MGLLDLGRGVSKADDMALAKKASKPKPKPKQAASTAVDDACRRVREQLGRYASRYLLFLDKDRDAFVRFVDKCVENGIVSIDTETNGKTHFLPTDLMAGFSVTTFRDDDVANTKLSCYVPLNHRSFWTKQRIAGQMDGAFARTQLERLFSLRTVWHNCKFDYEEFALRHGLRPTPYWDTLIAAHMLDENERHGLKYLYAKYVTQDEDDVFSFSSLFDSIKFPDIPVDVATVYAAHDTEMTADLYAYQRERLLDHPEKYDLVGVSNCFLNVEMPIIPCVAEMELVGIPIDLEYAESLTREYESKLGEAKRRYALECSKYREVITAYQKTHPKERLEDIPNYKSPKQVQAFLYDVMGLPPVDKKDPRGTGEDILKKFGEPVCDLILECRGYDKLIGTYTSKLPECVDGDGVIHASFNQIGVSDKDSDGKGVVTGRFSSSDPNLQNIPAKGEDSKIRRMFRARDGYVLVGSDYGQQEPHIMAEVAHDENMKRAYDEGKDLYAEIASLALKRPYRDFLEFQTNEDGSWKLDATGNRIENEEGHKVRSHFKAILLGIMYGKGATNLAEELKIKKEEAQGIIDSFYKAFPNVKSFIEWNMDKARKVGHVDTLWGRRRRLPDMMLPKYSVTVRDGYVKDFNPLAFGTSLKAMSLSKSEVDSWCAKMDKAYGYAKKADVIEQAAEQGITIVDNSMKVADAERQCCNSVIQGSAADMSKVAMGKMFRDKALNDLGFHILLVVHDEIIGECPEQNAKPVSERIAELMVEACHEKVHMRMKTDVEVTRCWKGDPIGI